MSPLKGGVQGFSCFGHKGNAKCYVKIRKEELKGVQGFS